MNFTDKLKSAIDFMSCSIPNEVEVRTKNTPANEMAIGMRFVDGKSAYTVTDINRMKGMVRIYATSSKNDGWFNKDNYDVIVS